MTGEGARVLPNMARAQLRAMPATVTSLAKQCAMLPPDVLAVTRPPCGIEELHAWAAELTALYAGSVSAEPPPSRVATMDAAPVEAEAGHPIEAARQV